jgi:hypothetical protein
MKRLIMLIILAIFVASCQKEEVEQPIINNYVHNCDSLFQGEIEPDDNFDFITTLIIQPEEWINTGALSFYELQNSPLIPFDYENCIALVKAYNSDNLSNWQPIPSIFHPVIGYQIFPNTLILSVDSQNIPNQPIEVKVILINQ